MTNLVVIATLLAPSSLLTAQAIKKKAMLLLIVRQRMHVVLFAAGILPLIVTAGCGGGSSTSTGQQQNPTPSLTKISPNTAIRGGQAFTLTANGSNFISSSAIQWNGTALSTTFVSPTELTAQISADLISVAGTDNISVFNPSPDGGTSPSLPFNIPCLLAQPTAASTQTQAHLGAYYFDGWAGPLNSYHLKLLVNSPYQDREPLSGWRDDNSCAVEQQLAWANSFGLNFFVFDWYFNTAVNDAQGNEDLNSALKITHSLSDRHGMQYAILYVDQPPFTISNSKDWNSAVTEWLGYMTDPAYLQVNGKPLLMVIDLYAMREAFGSSSAVNAAFSQLRAAAQAKGLPGVYIVGGLDFIGGSPVPAGTPSVDGIFPDLSMAVADGYDAISMYDYGSGLQNLGTISGSQPFSILSNSGNWLWTAASSKSPLPFIPVAMDGWDPRPQPPLAPATTFWVSPSPQDVTSLVTNAITWADSNPALRPEPAPAEPIVLIQAWNELLQGSILVPTAGAATSFGDALGASLVAPPTRTGTILTLNDSGPSDPNRTASGKLTDSKGTAVAGVPVSVAYIPSNGSTSTYQLSGLAPPPAVQGKVGFRVNTDYPAAWPGFWFAGPNPSNVSVYQFSYVESGNPGNLIPNSNFSSGAQGWTLQGQSQIVASDQGTGQMLQVVATPAQSAMLDSSLFPVAGGVSFQVAISARIPLPSAASGYFFLAFQDASGNFVPIPGPNPSDLKAETIPFMTRPLVIGTTTTDSAGNFSLGLTPLGSQQVLLESTYAGDAQHWPAYDQVFP